MTKQVSISLKEYEEYQKLKKEKELDEQIVDSSLKALEEGRVYDL